MYILAKQDCEIFDLARGKVKDSNFRFEGKIISIDMDSIEIEGYLIDETNKKIPNTEFTMSYEFGTKFETLHLY